MTQSLEYPKFESLDDLLHATYKHIMTNGLSSDGKRGKIKEIMNYAFTLKNPLSRVSSSLDRRLVKSKFAEFAWYLSKDADKEYIMPYIEAYNDEEAQNNKILGGYGPKIFDKLDSQESQFERIIKQIKARKDTKQAFLVLSDMSDYKLREEKYSSPPCTIGLHFIVRNNMLHLTVYMRSNDAYYGLPHDLFSFTMIQELIAHKLKIPLGTYTHVCTSIHIYEEKFIRVNQYIEEGLFETLLMPAMTFYDDKILNFIALSFGNNEKEADLSKLSPYWHDFALFSNRFIKNTPRKTWLEKFQTEEIKHIANLSTSP